MHRSILAPAAALLLLACGSGAPAPYEPVAVSDADRARAEQLLADLWEPLPENWEWRYFEIAPGGDLRWGVGGNPEAEETILFIPGFTGTIEYYTDFFARWAADGYRVVAVDMPGQGGSARNPAAYEKPWSNDLDDYGDVMAAFIDHIGETVPGNLTVIGESMAGGVLANAASRHDLKAERIVLHVPGLDVNFGDMPRWAGKALAHGLAALGSANAYVNNGSDWSLDWYEEVEDSRCRVDPEKLNVAYALTALNPDWRVGDATFGLVAAMLASGGALEKKGAAAIPQPVTLITANNDLIVRNDRAVALCSPEGFGDCTHIEIESGHCLSFEDRETQERFYAAVETAIGR